MGKFTAKLNEFAMKVVAFFDKIREKFNGLLLKIKGLSDKIVEKFGMDKIAHFALFGFIVALAGIFGLIPAIVAYLAMAFASCFKERADSVFDDNDIYAGVLGGFIAILVTLIRFLI